jgi:hypothetical protein
MVCFWLLVPEVFKDYEDFSSRLKQFFEDKGSVTLQPLTQECLITFQDT